MRYFKIPRSSRRCPFSYTLSLSLSFCRANREDSRIPRTPQGGDPRSSAPATRIQITKLFPLAPSRSAIVLSPWSREEPGEYGERKEKRGDVCASIYDVRWIGARASTLVTILMRLLYDVTFNGAPRPLPSGHNSPPGHPAFFAAATPARAEKNRSDRETRFRVSANTDSLARAPVDRPRST